MATAVAPDASAEDNAPSRWTVRDDPDTLLDIWVSHRTAKRDGATLPTLLMYSNGFQRDVEVFLPPDDEEDSYVRTLDDVLNLSFVSETRFQDGTHLAFLWLHMYERNAMRALFDSGCTTIDVHPWRLALSRKEGIDADTKARLVRDLV
jgi:hypothetical protein